MNYELLYCDIVRYDILLLFNRRQNDHRYHQHHWGQGFWPTGDRSGCWFIIWLVVWKIMILVYHLIENNHHDLSSGFFHIENNHPNWLSYFSEGWVYHQPVMVYQNFAYQKWFFYPCLEKPTYFWVGIAVTGDCVCWLMLIALLVEDSVTISGPIRPIIRWTMGDGRLVLGTLTFTVWLDDSIWLWYS